MIRLRLPVLVALLLAGPGRASSAESQEEGAGAAGASLEVVFLNVGQGDAILIVCPDGSPGAVIDSGDVPQRVPEARPNLQAGLHRYFGESKSLPLVIASHPHSDHIGNLPWLFGQYNIRAYLDNGQPPKKPSRTLESLETAAMTESTHDGMIRLTPDKAQEPAEICPTSKATVRALGPRAAWGNCSDHPNDCSVVVRLDFGKTSFLFVGDIEARAESRLLNAEGAKSLLDVDVLKIAHHGSETSTSPAFLKATSPLAAVISAGKPELFTNKGYRHPRLPTLDAILAILPHTILRPPVSLSAYDSRKSTWTPVETVLPIFLTAVDGDVVIESDGKKIILPGSGDHATPQEAP